MKLKKYAKALYTSCISEREINRFREDSIAIQPVNNPIQNIPVDDVILSGAEIMKNEGFHLLEGIKDV